MNQFEQNTSVLIIRLWLEPREIEGEKMIWRGMVETFPGGKRQFFQNIEGLYEIERQFLAERLVKRQESGKTMSDRNMDDDQPRPGEDYSGTEEQAGSFRSDPQEPLEALQQSLTRLDRLLAEMVLAAQSEYGFEAAQDLYRGLYIDKREVAQLLHREPVHPVLKTARVAPHKAASHADQLRPPRRFGWLGGWFQKKPPVQAESAGEPEADVSANPPGAQEEELEWLFGPTLPLTGSLDPDSPLAELARRYTLTTFDLDVMLIALAPELDLRYERLYAYLQDHVSRKMASVDLTLNLLCSTAEEKTARRTHFSPDAPLIRNRILQLISDREDPQAPLLSHFIRLDGQIVRFLINEQTLDPRLAPFATLTGAGDLESILLDDPVEDASLLAMVEEAWTDGQSLRLYFTGQPGSGQHEKAEWLAAELGLSLLTVDIARVLEVDPRMEWAPQAVFREAWLQMALPYLRGFDELRCEDRQPALEAMWKTLVEEPGITLLEGAQPWQPVPGLPGSVLTIPFTVLNFPQRKARWEALLARAELYLAESEVNTLAARFHLTRGQIDNAFDTALALARLHAASSPELAGSEALPRLEDFFKAARAETGHGLAALARKVEPVYHWEDVVLPEDVLAQLHEIAQRVAQRNTVLYDWGFDSKLSLGKGTMVLFAGPSGTGKTMAAEILSGDLGLDLYKIDLSGVVSKYIGETERNLETLFRAAENSNTILFFDECEAIFGKRTEVRDAHDRYANIEISYLLQRMEAYDGMTILSTNLRQNLDDAFVRRMTFSVTFPFPDEASRRKIWAGIWPANVPCEFTGADLDEFAAQFKLAGGHIRNIALAAAFLAAAEGVPVNREHVLRGIQREYQKMGKSLTTTELESQSAGGRPESARLVDRR